MATVYKVEIVSYWINYHEKDIERLLLKALNSDDNEVEIKVIERK